MSYLEPKELIKAENLIEEGKLEKALQLVNDFFFLRSQSRKFELNLTKS